MRILSIIGCHAFFCLEGDVIDSLTVGPTSKPDTDPIENWRSLGVIEENDINVAYEGATDHYAPVPGRYAKRRTTYTSVNVSGALLCQDMDEFIMSLAMGAKQADGAGNYVPGSQGTPQRGWLKLQHYNAEDDQKVNLMDVWVEFRIGGGIKFSSQPTKPNLEFMLLDSPLNVGKFSNLSPSV